MYTLLPGDSSTLNNGFSNTEPTVVLIVHSILLTIGTLAKPAHRPLDTLGMTIKNIYILL